MSARCRRPAGVDRAVWFSLRRSQRRECLLIDRLLANMWRRFDELTASKVPT